MDAPLRLTLDLMRSELSSSRCAPSSTLSFMQILIMHLRPNALRTFSNSASSRSLPHTGSRTDQHPPAVSADRLTTDAKYTTVNTEGRCCRFTTTRWSSYTGSSMHGMWLPHLLLCTSVAASEACTPVSETRNSIRCCGGQSVRTLRMGLEVWKLMSGPSDSECTIREKAKERPPRCLRMSSLLAGTYRNPKSDNGQHCSRWLASASATEYFVECRHVSQTP